LIEVPKKVLEDIKIIYVRHMDEVIRFTLDVDSVAENPTIKKVKSLIQKERQEHKK